MSMTTDIAEYTRAFTKDEINNLPLFRYEGRIEIVRDLEALHRALARIRQERLLGFDTESRPCFRKGMCSTPALIQIACSDVVYLIQLPWLPFNEAMADCLADPDLIKTGVAIGDDIRLLAKTFPFTGAGLVDLKDIARAKGLATRGLRSLAANFLHVRISKSAQCSNWENRELTQQQVYYAATDAWISRQIYERMSELGFFAEETTFCIPQEDVRS